MPCATEAAVTDLQTFSQLNLCLCLCLSSTAGFIVLFQYTMPVTIYSAISSVRTVLRWDRMTVHSVGVSIPARYVNRRVTESV